MTPGRKPTSDSSADIAGDPRGPGANPVEALARYRLIVENQTEFIVSWLPDGTRTFVNPRYCQYFGLTEAECVGTSFLDLLPQEHRDTLLSQVETLSPNHSEFTEEHEALTPDGELRWQEWTSRGIFDPDGLLAEIQSSGRDVTERRQMEQALRESEELHRVTLANISDAVFITDDDGRFAYICPNVDVIFGLTRSEVSEMDGISALLGPPVVDPVRLRVSGEIRNIERDITDKSGRVHSLLINLKSVAIQGGTILLSCRDVTEHKRAEDAQRESEQRYRLLIDNIPSVVWGSRRTAHRSTVRTPPGCVPLAVDVTVRPARGWSCRPSGGRLRSAVFLGQAGDLRHR